MSAESSSPQQSTWHKIDSFLMISKIVTDRRSAAMLFLGFAAGLPILLVFTVSSAWLREVGVSKSTIGFFIWCGLAYSFKFAWAPLLDRFSVPGFGKIFGRRRSWMLVAMFGLFGSLMYVAQLNPGENLAAFALATVLVAFSSATLDIGVDAWRIESAQNDAQAAMASIYQLGYRLGMVTATSGALFLAHHLSWSWAYTIMAVLSLIGASTLLWAGEPSWVKKFGTFGIHLPSSQKTLLNLFVGFAFVAVVGGAAYGFLQYMGLHGGAQKLGRYFPDIPGLLGISPVMFGFIITCLILIGPFVMMIVMTLLRDTTSGAPKVIKHTPVIGDFADLAQRMGWFGLLFFAIIATYRISDYTMGVMTMPFYIDLGYEKDVIGTVKGLWGITIMIVGAFLGAWASLKYGLARAMIIGAVLTILTNLAFSWLALQTTPRAIYLFVTIGADNIAAGFAGSVFIAFMSVLTSQKFTATQYAIFSSLYALYGKLLAGYSGVLSDAVGHFNFFAITAAFGVPALLLVIIAWKVDLIGRASPDDDVAIE